MLLQKQKKKESTEFRNARTVYTVTIYYTKFQKKQNKTKPPPKIECFFYFE